MAASLYALTCLQTAHKMLLFRCAPWLQSLLALRCMVFAMTHLLDAPQRLHSPGYFCSVYRNQDQQFASAIPFIRLGLVCGERCLHGPLKPA